MNKQIFILISTFILSTACYAQERFSMDENRVTQYEMDMTEYPEDPEAEAVVIYEKGDYRFVFDDREGFKLRMTIHTKIKILSQAGEKYATFEIPLYASDSRRAEEVDKISGVTYNWEGGNLIKTEFIPRGNVFDEKVHERRSLKKFTLPNVKTGSVIEVKYTIQTPFFVNMRAWEFQKKIPVVYSFLRYRAIPFYEYVFTATNLEHFDERDSKRLLREITHGSLTYGEMEHTFGLKNIPAFRDEEFIASSSDYMQALHFQLARIYHPRGGKEDYMSTWEGLSDELLKHIPSFGKYIKDARKESKKILPTLQLDEATESEKIDKILDYVKQNFNWDGFYGRSASQKVSDFVKTRRGNVGDINLFLVGMLTEAGLNVTPSILSTRNYGKINKNYPFIQYFNYTMGLVMLEDGNVVFVDATEPMLPNKVIPLRVTNTDALLVSKEPKWGLTRQRTNSYLQKELTINIKSKQNVEVNAVYTSTGEAAYNHRAKYMGKEDNLIKYLKQYEDIDVKDGVKTINFSTLNKPFQMEFSFSTIAEGNNEKIFINPFVNLFSKDNLFKQKSRTYPVDFNEMMTRQYFAKINIPEGYEIEFIPESMNMNDGLMSMIYSHELKEDGVEVNFAYGFLDYVYAADKYSTLKENYTKLLSKLSEMIVFRKKQISEE